MPLRVEGSVAEMTEAARAKVVFGVLEALIEPDRRSVSQVWSSSQPLTGEEFEQVSSLQEVVHASCQLHLAIFHAFDAVYKH